MAKKLTQEEFIEPEIGISRTAQNGLPVANSIYTSFHFHYNIKGDK